MSKKIKSIIFSFIACLALIGAPTAALASSNHDDHGNSNAGDKVTICHATGSSTNPYVKITPDANGVVSGHEAHQDGDDIIPPFDYNDHGTIKHFPGQNWDSTGIAIFDNGCKIPEGGHGGGEMDCDGDFDNSPASDCTTPQPQKDCDGDFDSSAESECTTPSPQTDCDGDTDNSAATECTPGMGGGPTGGGTTTTTTTSGTPQVLAATTTAGQGAAQVAVLPQGSVNGGEGAASKTLDKVSLVGLTGALLSVGSGLAMLNRRKS